MGTIHDINLRQQGKPLKDLADPCTGCDSQLICCHTCQRAETWWEEFAVKLKRQNVIYQLGGE